MARAGVSRNRNPIRVIKAMYKRHKAVKDGSVWENWADQQIKSIQAVQDGWVIEFTNVTSTQREILKEALGKFHIPGPIAEWVAARCPEKYLPSRTAAEALDALERWGEPDRTSSWGSVSTWPPGAYFSSGPVIKRPPGPFSAAPIIKRSP